MIKFASINIEGDSHRRSVVSFLREFGADVICFQELSAPSLAFFEHELGMKGYFLPIGSTNAVPQDKASPVEPFGVALFSSFPISNIKTDYYDGGVGDVPTIIHGDENTIWRGLLQGTVTKGDERYNIAVTHFTRTPDGSASDKQRRDMRNLLNLLVKTPEVILCGDFNAPRGGEIFKMIADTYKDNIPPEYDTSLDSKLHRIERIEKGKKLMVDGLFTTSAYIVSDAKLSEGVSDHKAVTAIISLV